MNINTLNILADAISDVGAWHRWLIRKDMVQVQFCDIMLYDENAAENEPQSICFMPGAMMLVLSLAERR